MTKLTPTTIATAAARGRAPTVAPRTVTTEQVGQAVVQLRERSGLPPAEQMRAVLQALDLTVAAAVVEIPAQRG